MDEVHAKEVLTATLRRLDQKQALRISRDVYRACNEVLNGRILDAYLYGSYARGDYHDDSDIDIFLVVDAAVEEIGLLRQKIADIESDLSLEYDVTISVAVKPAEQVRRYAAMLPYYANVMREGIRIHGTTRGGSS